MPDAPPRLITQRVPRHEYDVEVSAGTLYITTNSAGAEDFRIVTAPLADPAQTNWRDFIAHKPGCLILDVVVYSRHLVRLERENGLPRIVIRELASGAEHTIAFDEEAYSLGLSTGYEFDTTQIRFTYSSMTTPSETWDYDMATRARVLRKRQEVPSGHDPHAYVTRRLMAPAPDGETVPVSITSPDDNLASFDPPVTVVSSVATAVGNNVSISVGKIDPTD